MILNESKTTFYMSVWVPPSWHVNGSSAWLDSLRNFQLRQSSFTDNQSRHLRLLSSILARVEYVATMQNGSHGAMASLNPIQYQDGSHECTASPEHIQYKDGRYQLRSPQVLDKMVISTRTHIVHKPRFSTSLVTHHPTCIFRIRASDLLPKVFLFNIVTYPGGPPVYRRWPPLVLWSSKASSRVMFGITRPMLPTWQEETFCHSLQKSPIQTCLQRPSSGFISHSWMELAARALVCLKDWLLQCKLSSKALW